MRGAVDHLLRTGKRLADRLAKSVPACDRRRNRPRHQREERFASIASVALRLFGERRLRPNRQTVQVPLCFFQYLCRHITTVMLTLSAKGKIRPQIMRNYELVSQ